MQSTCILNMYTYDMYLQVSGAGAATLTLTSLREIMEDTRFKGHQHYRFEAELD